MSMRDLIDNAAELGSDSDDEEFGEETGEQRPRKTNGHIDDSSEEDEDDDEEAERAVGDLNLPRNCTRSRH